MQSALDRLSSLHCHLALNPKKTKAMLFSTSQMSRLHGLDAVFHDLSVNGKQIEQVSTFPLLGTQVHQNLKRNNEMNSKTSICYRTLAVVRKLKHLAPFAVRKQLSECLIISKINYNAVVSHPIPDYLLKRFYCVQLATASFVLGPASYPGAPLFYRDQWQLINAKRAKVLGQHAKKPSAQGC